MRGIYKRLILLFIALSSLKIILSFFISSPTMFADEYFYSSMARSFFKSGNFMIFGSPSHEYGPIYPIILSFAYIFKDMRIIYAVFKIINALLSSLIIFPVWLLAKEFLNKRKAFLIAILCGIWSVSFIFSFIVMAENLFYVLVLFTVYFAYKSFTNENIKWDFFAGLFLGLAYLTKVLGIALVVGILMSFLIHLIIKRDLSQIKRKLFLYGIALLTVLPWLMRNGKIFGWTLKGIVGYADEFNLIATNFHFNSLFYWILMNFSYLILATGVIIFIFNFLSINCKSEKLKILSIIAWSVMFCFIIIASIRAAKSGMISGWLLGKPMGRHIEVCIPLMLILGFVNLKFKENFYKNKLKYILICTLLIIASFKLFSFNLFPVNSISLSYVGLINFGLKYLIGNYRILIMTILFAALPLYLMFIRYLNFKKLFYFIGLFFITINIIAFGMIYYNSNYRWAPLDQMQLGLWFNDNVDSTDMEVLLDERDDAVEFTGDTSDSLKIVERRMRRMSFWMNAYVNLGNVDKANLYDYVVSKHDLNYNLVKQIGDFKLYKIK